MRRDRYRPFFFFFSTLALDCLKDDCIRRRRRQRTNVQREDVEKLVIDSFSLFTSSLPSLCIIKGVITETDDTKVDFRD